jgi:hypothetical protein
MMTEAQAIAGQLGIEFRVSIEKRIAGAEKVGKHKTSMLQDVEAGREPEIDALVGSVIELGRLTGTASAHGHGLLSSGSRPRSRREITCARCQEAVEPAGGRAPARSRAGQPARLASTPVEQTCNLPRRRGVVAMTL